MKHFKSLFFLACLSIYATRTCSQNITDSAISGNPIIPGWYADPEARIFDQTYWIYPTFSDDNGTPQHAGVISKRQLAIQKNTINPQYLKQTFLDAFSSRDLVHWDKHSHVLDIENVAWAADAVWAPSIVKKESKYFLFFGANDIQNDNQVGGIGVAVSDQPYGPFKDYLGKPLVGKFYNQAQPIDQFVFLDADGQYYLIYGGWKHCNIGRLNKDFTGFIPFENGELFKSITPDNYVEGPFMFLRNKKYYLMWSEGNWTGPDYSVAYAIGDSPLGPFKRIGKVLQQDSLVATGAGHHSVINIPHTDDWYIIYHRRPLNTSNGNHRETCIDKMFFDENGYIKPVKITKIGVEKRRLDDSSHLLVTPHPIPEAVMLYNYIREISGKKILSGQHSVPLLGSTRLAAVYKMTGEYPAVFGPDFGFSFPGDWDGINFRQQQVDEAIKKNNEGFIITLMWHAVPPTKDEPVEFKKGIQSKLSDEEWKDLVTPGTTLNDRWKSQVDVIAFFLKQLQYARVPVLWRPYHEMNGDWFWWGKKKGENGYKKLYKMLFDRLVNFHGLNNLIWVYNTNEFKTGVDSLAEYYPGNKYVDIITTDVYTQGFDQENYRQITELAGTRPIALGEVGSLPDAAILKQQPRWAWFMNWSDPSGKSFDVYKNDQVIKLRDLPWVHIKEPIMWYPLLK